MSQGSRRVDNPNTHRVVDPLPCVPSLCLPPVLFALPCTSAAAAAVGVNPTSNLLPRSLDRRLPVGSVPPHTNSLFSLKL